MLALPTALASLILALVVIFGLVSVFGAAAAGYAVGGKLGTAAGLGTGALLALAGFAVGIVISCVAQAVVMRAAEEAWQGRPVDLAASLAAVAPRLADLAVALVLCFLIMIVPVALSFLFIGIPLVILAGFFLMYVFPAVINGGEGGMQAIKTSFRLSRGAVGPSAIAFLGIVIATLVGSAANGITSHIPLLNLVVPFAVGGLTSAYAALVSSRFFDLLSGRSPAYAAVPVASPPAPLG
jgi:hypothetical protein